MSEFVHLHVHSEYSLLDGLSSCQELAERAAEFGMPAVALTDHGVMYGAVQFYKSCRAAGVKPIIGMEAYVAPRGRRDKHPQLDRSPHHLVLLAQDNTGYHNLMRLATIAQLEGFYYKPRIDKEVLAEYSEGLIALSGCGSSELSRLLKEGKEEEARRVITWYREVFPGRYYLELQEHDIPELTAVNRQVVALAREMDLPLVATNDSHYTRREEARIHDVLLCIQTGKTVNEPKRMRMSGDSFYFRSAEEMAALFAEVPDALTNTLRIAEMCEVELEFGHYHLPIFDVPEGYDAQSYLRHLCEEGLRRRYNPVTEREWKRLNYELDVIHKMGFDTYFLIVWDLCRFSREQNIWWNVRGSGASSIVAYSLGITNLEPLQHNLIFERFLNEGRVTMPDIDLDYPDDQRAQLIRYTIEKYGQEQVAQIITFGTMGAKAAIRDVGRALDYPLNEVDRIARLVPAGPKVKLEQSLADVPELREAYENEEHIRRLIDTARGVEGNIRHASTHAAGVIVSDRPLVEYAPLHRPTRGGEGDEIGVVTQYTMEELEELGLLKIDFLGLSTLTIMRRACELIEERHGIHFDLTSIPIDDPAIYDLLSRGDVMGVFQVEGAGMRRTLMKMQPHEFDHIIAAISLYRPGPMEYIDDYIDRLHGKKPVEYRHPSLKPILEETYGILVYQEQIIRVLTDIAGYKPGEADLVRRAVGKKKKKALIKHRASFVKGAAEYGNLPREIAEGIFDDIEYFARYGFNKCLPGDVEIVDAATGRPVRIEDVYSGLSPVSETITCDLDTLRLKTGRITAVMDNGIKPVYRLVTALGRQIEATANHPFYTVEGWRRLDEIRAGDRVAVPRSMPPANGCSDGDADLCWDEVRAIEYVGEKRTYDLTVEGTHNFIANGILVHNSHAADYAVLTCQTAYLKAKYPVEYMTALLTVERHNTDKVGLLIAECRRMGIEVLPPDINRSGLDFTIEELGDGSPAIRFGLGAVKNVGEGPIETILSARRDGPFADLDDFCQRVDLRQVNRRALESLIKVGALRHFGTRAQLLPIADRIIGLSANLHRAAEVGQMSLFGDVTGVHLDADEALLADTAHIAEVDQREILEWEKELVGVYISEHPLSQAINRLQDVITAYAGALSTEMSGQQVTVVGMVQRVRRHTTKRGDEMAFVTLEDIQGTCDVVVFPRVWKKTKDLWQVDRILVVSGKVDAGRRDTPNLLCDWAKLPDDVAVPTEHPAAEVPSPAPPPVPPPPSRPRTVRVIWHRSGDRGRDVETLRRLYDMLTGQSGDDHFVIRLLDAAQPPVELMFPNVTTRYTPELEMQLRTVGAVEVELR